MSSPKMIQAAVHAVGSGPHEAMEWIRRGIHPGIEAVGDTAFSLCRASLT